MLVKPHRRLYFTSVPDEQDMKSVVVLNSPANEVPLSRVLKFPTEGFKPFSEKLMQMPSVELVPLFVTETKRVMYGNSYVCTWPLLITDDER